MQADDDVSSFQQLVEHAEALQHDVEQAEHDRQADDDSRTADDERDPYDDAVLYIARHDDTTHFVIRRGTVEYQYGGGNCVYRWQQHGPASLRRIPVDEPASGDRSS